MRANVTRLVLGGGGGRPDYLQKLKVPEGYSAVSKPKFAIKYALESSRPDLYNALFEQELDVSKMLSWITKTVKTKIRPKSEFD